MMLYTITTLILVIPAFFAIKMLLSFVLDVSGHRKTMKKMKDWSKLHKELLDWSEEITDKDVKKEYLLHCVDIISNNRILDSESLRTVDISKTREDIVSKFSNHIPSLKQELRENRINKILNYEKYRIPNRMFMW